MMRLRPLLLVFMLLATAAMGHAQSWSSRYEEAMAYAKKADWMNARESFRQATTYRPEDASQPTMMPGPNGTRIKWHDGSPYSPNFLLALCRYRMAQAESDVEAKKQGFLIAAAELEVLLDRGQSSREAYFFLDRIYTELKEEEALAALNTRAQKEPDRAPWRVDSELLSEEERSGAAAYVLRKPLPPVPEVRPAVPGRVTVIPTKFALVIGVRETKVADAGLAFAAESARTVRDALVSSAGYPEENVELLLNASADKILAAAKNLGERIPADATVFVYYSGIGANLSGMDCLAGADATSLASAEGTVAKLDLLRPFTSRGARVFAFFEVDRPPLSGKYFGSQIPSLGGVSQVQATAPGEKVQATNRLGKPVGAFAVALADVLAELKSNQIPIGDFGWKLYYKIEKLPGLTTKQTPSLPILTNLSAESRF